MTAEMSLRIERTFQAPAARVFEAWTWDDDSDRETLIELDFLEAEGRTTVLLTHSALADEDAVRNHEDGWTKCLENLGRALV